MFITSSKNSNERALSSKQPFFSEINNVGTTDKTREMLKKYQISRINNLKEYQDLHNTTDVGLIT